MISAFTDEQKRLVNTYYPALGSIPPSVGSGGLLGVIEAKLQEAVASTDIVAGEATVLNGASTVVVAVGAAYDGKPAWACRNDDADPTVPVQSCVVAGGNLTIKLTGNVTADRTVRYWIDAR